MTDTNINIIQDSKQKIIKLLNDSGWATKLRLFLNSEDMDKLLEKLLTESKEGRNFTPTLKDIFNAFVKCPFDSTKVIIIGQDPYPGIGVADGLAFSCSKTGKAQPSLKYLFGAVERQTKVFQEDVDLTRWANQGVLLLNTALTCQIDKVGSHYEIWSEFMFMVIDALNFSDNSFAFILMGKQAHNFENYINPRNLIIKTSHPASAAYAKANEWDANNCFIKANEFLISQQKTPVIW